MRRVTRLTKPSTLVVPVLLALIAIGARDAGAVSVTECETTCTTNCDLAADLDCLSYAVTLANGADFDFKGHTIGCSFEGSCGGPAIVMTGNNSVVKDSGNASGVKGGLRGGYVIGIDCVGKAGSQVTGVLIDGVEGTAVKDCGVVDHSTLVGGGEDDEYVTYAIERNFGTANSGDAISDNYISWFGRGIKAQGTKPITIERNVLVAGPGLTPRVGIFTSGTAAAKVRSNTILSEEDDFPPLALNATSQGSSNFCDATKSGCATCVVNGQCEPFEHAICDVEVVPYRTKITGNGSLNQADTTHPINFPLQYRYFLVTDYPEVGDGFTVSGVSSLQYTGTGIGIGTDLFTIGLFEVEEGVTFASCTLRSHMQSEGTDSQTTPTWLVVRRAGVQSDGAQINVHGGFRQEYTRVMTTSPITNQPWTSDELRAGNYQIGVKNNVGSGLGVGFTDLQLDCQ